ncbi:NMDA receptor-regulated protein 1-domain-containing protein [Lipomyces oligophaga]|uniref:NMDA receptor-regulated protein 1-domain-containing protein n=1 Tax=Lipomyces oligophaga TaxID=45792 RepID=UPI0034CFF296
MSAQNGIPKQRYLAPKEATAFRQVLKLYESHQYRKALKVADLILKKYPDHGETLAMKGLITCFMDNREEGHELIKRGLRNDLSSFICWHVYGLYYRTEKNFEEAAKCYAQALKYDPENSNILRDLSFLQIQMRNIEGYVSSRNSILAHHAETRQNWTMLAVGHHLLKHYERAETILTKYEETVPAPTAADKKAEKTVEKDENSELLLYKNVIIYESGDVSRALENLEKISDQVLDKLAVLEYRAKYLFELGRLKESTVAYQKLLNRNPDSKEYCQKLEAAMGISEDVDKRKQLYATLAEKYKRVDLFKIMPLSFLKGEEFALAAKSYLLSCLGRGVPSTFVNLKPLYDDAEKVKAIETIVTEFLKTLNRSGDKSLVENEPTTYLWTVYYLALHHSKVGNQALALEYIEKALDHTPTLVEAYMVKAKILKRKKELEQAADVIVAGRELDLQDRFINTKAGKYLLRANKNEEAIDTVSLFTKNDGPGKGVGDLHDMQGIWFLQEQGEMYDRIGKVGLALKRLLAVKKIVDDWWGDQFDFHQYSTRRGTVRAYLAMLKWEDTLYAQPYYTRAAKDAIEIYVSLYEVPKSERQAKALSGLSEDDRKKALKKLKRDRAKENKKGETEKINEKDADPLGKTLENTATPLKDALALWKPVKDSGVMDQEWEELGASLRKKLEQQVRAAVEAAAVPKEKNGEAL